MQKNTEEVLVCDVSIINWEEREVQHDIISTLAKEAHGVAKDGVGKLGEEVGA